TVSATLARPCRGRSGASWDKNNGYRITEPKQSGTAVEACSMRRLPVLVLVSTVALTSVPSAQQAGALKAAADRLGVAGMKTLQFSASGSAFQIGQNFIPSEPWPPVLLKTYAILVNYDTRSMRIEQVRDLSVPQPRGGGAV